MKPFMHYQEPSPYPESSTGTERVVCCGVGWRLPYHACIAIHTPTPHPQVNFLPIVMPFMHSYANPKPQRTHTPQVIFLSFMSLVNSLLSWLDWLRFARQVCGCVHESGVCMCALVRGVFCGCGCVH